MKNKIKLGVVVTSLFINLSKKEIEFASDQLSKYFDVKLYFPETKPDEFGSIPIEQKISLINSASSECEVLLSLCGGFNQIELLQSFGDLKFRKENIFVGQSDNTVLVNALTALGVCKSLYGKGFYNMATDKSNTSEMVEELFAAVNQLKLSKVSKSNPTLVGGNNYTFDLLQGTRFCPKFNKPFVLFMEGEDILKDSSEIWVDFIRNIDSIMLQKGAVGNLKGLVIGKFPDSIKITSSQVNKFIKARPYLKDIPVSINYPCGHNNNSLKYLPIGGKVSVKMLNLILI
jgi:muramoyltetrapeptide carboxypeptidase LdcA involved in peptidoglycan recycling